MERTPVDEAAWQPWVREVAGSVGMDAGAVSIHTIHEMTSLVSLARSRPMAPVAAYIWGLAEKQHPDVDREELKKAIIAAAEHR